MNTREERLNKYALQAREALEAHAYNQWLNQIITAKTHLQKVCAHPDCKITFHHKGDYCCIEHHNECESKR